MMWLPPELAAQMGTQAILYCDKDWFWDFRNDNATVRADKIAMTLKYNLDLHLQGNRAPFHLCLHSQEWDIPPWETNRTEEMLARQAALKDFLNYSLSKPEVRIVRMNDVINWMREPEQLS